MLTSFVIPVHNGMPFLADTIASIFEQDLDEIEIIICDDGSTDGTTLFLDRLHVKEIKVVNPHKRLTAGENWTYVSNLATGKYMKLICADDVLLAGSAKIEIEALENYTHAVATFGVRKVMSQQGHNLFTLQSRKTPFGLIDGNEMIRRCYLNGTNLFGEPANIMFRTKNLQNALPWSSEFPYLLDMSLYVKAFHDQKLVSLSKHISAFRIRSNSISLVSATTQSNQFQKFFKFSKVDYIRELRSSKIGVAISWFNSNKRQKIRRVVYLYSRLVDLFFDIKEIKK